MKSIVQWNYERGSWQYDIFCLLIIAFIFLTPKEFNKTEMATPAVVQTVKTGAAER